ncbi:MAG: RNA polymerase sigma factor [Alphaproteobacteria bacterium]|nr:RNA polymerase sigma factor [Alphaproteobacteria bacterium]
MESLRRDLQTHAARLYGYAYALSKNPADAEDLVQDVFVKAMSAQRAPSDPDALRAWLFRILRNAFIDLCRRTRREAALDVGREAEADEAFEPPVGAEPPVITQLTVRFGLMKLSPPHREILALVDIAGFTYGEAAEILDVPTGTVMSRLSRARAALIDAIGESNILPMRRRGRTA